MIKISSKSERNCRLRSDKIELFVRYFIDDLMARGRALNIFKFLLKFDGEKFQSRGNGGAWYIEKLSSNFISLTKQSDSPLCISLEDNHKILLDFQSILCSEKSKEMLQKYSNIINK
jgi:hypothetical protein